MGVEFILSIIISAIAGAIIENKLKVMFFFKKLKALILNSKTNLKVSFLFLHNSGVDNRREKAKIKDVFFKSDKEWKASYEDENRIVYSDGEMELFVGLLNTDGTIIIETTNISVVMRDVKDTFDTICDIVKRISEKSNYKLVTVEFKAKLPYYQDIGQFYIPRHFEVKDYSITMKDKKLQVELQLVLGVITATNEDVSELKTLFNRVLSF